MSDQNEANDNEMAKMIARLQRLPWRHRRAHLAVLILGAPAHTLRSGRLRALFDALACPPRRRTQSPRAIDPAEIVDTETLH